jgi:acyl transferase domain-containing protein
MTMNPEVTAPADGPDRIAIIGMAGRFPGAPDVDALWHLSLDGGSGLRHVGWPDGLQRVRGVLDGTDRFDAAYFGVPAHEAALLEPQHKVLLEVAQHAFDDAGVDRGHLAESTAVYMACAATTLVNTQTTVAGRYEFDLATAADFAATRLSYRLGLRGESLTVQTGCSSSLVAVHLAAQSLLSGQSELALAGGVSFPADQNVGYAVEEGMIASPSGVCRPFDAHADGTVPGGGCAVVVLQRLDDALRDGNPIRAVILGSAINNDGATKVGFMAPSSSGQAEVIATAHAVAGVEPASIGYVETHGTATRLGDAVEIEGLRRAFVVGAARSQPCRLGSLKANSGHLDRAAGVAGLVRAVLVLEHGVIPPMAGFTTPNPDLGLESAGFEVPTRAVPWTDLPRRAGVSSFGVGGTNVHLVLEQAPPVARASTPASAAASQSDGSALWLLGGHDGLSLQTWAGRLADRLDAEGDVAVADVAAELVRRPAGEQRAAVVARTASEGAAALRRVQIVRRKPQPTLVLAFGGQGDPVVDGLPDLYRGEPVFRDSLGRAAARIEAGSGTDLLADLYAADLNRAEIFADMSRFQPALLSVQVALIQLWQSWGFRAEVAFGHSVGELAAAVAASILTPDDALDLVLRRSQLMEQTSPGQTLSVGLGVERIEPLLVPGTYVAADNGRELTTVTGAPKDIEALVKLLEREGILFRRLNIRHSPHGPGMAPAGEALVATLRGTLMSAPRLRLTSNVTGDWAGAELAEPTYWGLQLRSPIRFREQLDRITDLPDPVVVPLTPGVSFARMLAHELAGTAAVVLSPALSPETVNEPGSRSSWLAVAGQAWSSGVQGDLSVLCPPQTQRVVLPPTVFDHRNRWPTGSTGVAVPASGPAVSDGVVERHADPGAWLYEPAWAPEQVDRGDGGRVITAIGGANSWAAVVCSAAEALGRRTAASSDEVTPTEPLDVLWSPSSWTDLLPDAAALATRLHGQDARIWLLAGGPEQVSLAEAVSRVVPQEVPGPVWNVVELPDHGPTQATTGLLLALLASPVGAGPWRLTAEGVLRRVERRLYPSWRSRPLRPDGCYLITGGTGRVGRALALGLAREVAANLVLVARTAPPAPEWESLRDAVIALGSTVSFVPCDVTDPVQVATCLDELRGARGRIDGVIHAAGETDRRSFALAAETSPQDVARISAAKITGARALAAALEPDEADFVLLCSSLSVILGGVRFGAYAAANAWLDGFARERYTAGDHRWLSVRWDAWTAPLAPAASQLGPARYALDDDDGREVLRRVLAAPGPIVTVSTGELTARIREVAEQVIGRSALAPGNEHAASAVPPADVIRETLREVLGQVPEDEHRDLRHDGVESLAILQIVTRLRQRSGAAVPLAEAAKRLSIAGLAELIEAASGASVTQEPFRIDQAPAMDLYPTTSTQRRWLELLPEGYGGIDLIVEVTGPVEPEQLRAAARAVVERHSGLRTVFPGTGGHGPHRWQQRILPAGDFPLVDLRDNPTDEQGTKVRQLVTETASRPFDVQSVAPFELSVVALGPAQNLLLLHAHHVLFDGWSSSLFLRDIALAVRHELPEAPPQYVDYALAHDRYLDSASFRQERAHWVKVFEGAPSPTRIPVRRGDPDAGDRGEVIECRLDAGTVAALRERAVTRGMTPFTLLMSAFAVLVHREVGGGDLVVGTTAAGRPGPQAEEVIGVFVNPLPLRLRFDPLGSVEDLVGSVNAALVDFHEHGNYPLEDLVVSVPTFAGMGLNDTFHCYLLYQNYWRPDGFGLGFSSRPLPDGLHHKLMRDVEVVVVGDGGNLVCEFWYRADRYAADWAQAASATYLDLVSRLSDETVYRGRVCEL